MRTIILACGEQASALVTPLLADAAAPSPADLITVSDVPSRQELRVIDEAAKEILPVDPTPSLDEIAAQPDVAHLGAPGPAPQPTAGQLRIVVVGTDAALSAVLTRMMRGDYLWATVGFVPCGGDMAAGRDSDVAAGRGNASTAAQNWGLPTDPAAALDVALTAPVRPVPLIRNDAGLAVAGHATISEWAGTEKSVPALEGEIVVDSTVLSRPGDFGARLVPMVDAPGIAAVAATGPLTGAAPAKPGFLARVTGGLFGAGGIGKRAYPGQLDPERLLTGRAVQAGGPSLRVAVDGVPGKRAVDRVTFYRHLRDLQVARP